MNDANREGIDVSTTYPTSNIRKSMTISSKTTFLALWAAQMASLLGSDIVTYSLRVWTYFETNSVQSFCLITFFTETPALLLSPFAGVLVDRYPRKNLLLISDGICALCTLIIALLYAFGILKPWHIYLSNTISSIMSALQWPAFKATVSLLIPPEDLVRYGGLDQAAPALSQLLSPIAASLIMTKYGLSGAFFTEVITFLVALGITGYAYIPLQKRTLEGQKNSGYMLMEGLVAWDYICQRRGLVGLLFLLASGHLSSGMVRVLMTPVLLNMGNTNVLGYVLSASGLGALFGSILLAIIGGPKKRKVYAVLFCAAGQGILLMACGITQSAMVMLVISTIYMALIPLNRSCRESIWQRKVPEDLQGRVFGVQRLISEASSPVAALAAGPLADLFFEPWLQVNGYLYGTPIGQLVGTGKGRGSAFMFVIAGLMNLIVATCGFSYSPLRRVDIDLPDRDENSHSKIDKGFKED